MGSSNLGEPHLGPVILVPRPGRSTGSAPRRIRVIGWVLAAILLATVGCQSGWDDKDTLDQLYREDENGRLTARGSIRKPTLGGRITEAFLGPFGYEPSRSEHRVNQPGATAREALRGLAASLDGNVPLRAFALPLFSELALQAPFALTRAQALRALADAVQIRSAPPPAPEATEPEEAASVNRAILELIGQGDSRTKRTESAAAPPPPERQRALVRQLGRIDYRTLPLIRNALKALGFAADRYVPDHPALEEPVALGVDRLGRQLARLTVTAVIQNDRDPLVRSQATLVLRAVGEPWAERMLLGLLATETDPTVLRKVVRSLVVYRTPAAARALLALYRQRPTPLAMALAKRGLLNYTRKDLGRDPDVWEARLRELGYLDKGK